MRFRSYSFTVVALLVLCAMSSSAQTVDKNRSFFSPDQQWGFGVNNRGFHVQYAMGPAFHIGLNLALDLYKDSARSETFYNFGPYAKFIFSGEVVKPYIWAALGVIQANTGRFVVDQDPSVDVKLPDPEIRAYLAFGAEHFFNQNVGIYGHVNLLEALLAGEKTIFEREGAAANAELRIGLLGGTAGVEFFF